MPILILCLEHFEFCFCFLSFFGPIKFCQFPIIFVFPAKWQNLLTRLFFWAEQMRTKSETPRGADGPRVCVCVCENFSWFTVSTNTMVNNSGTQWENFSKFLTRNFTCIRLLHLGTFCQISILRFIMPLSFVIVTRLLFWKDIIEKILIFKLVWIVGTNFVTITWCIVAWYGLAVRNF